MAGESPLADQTPVRVSVEDLLCQLLKKPIC